MKTLIETFKTSSMDVDSMGSCEQMQRDAMTVDTITGLMYIRNVCLQKSGGPVSSVTWLFD